MQVSAAMLSLSRAVSVLARTWLLAAAVVMWLVAAVTISIFCDACTVARRLRATLSAALRSPLALRAFLVSSLRHGRGTLTQCTAVAERRWQQGRTLAWELRLQPLAFMQLATIAALRAAAGQQVYSGAMAHAQSLNIVMSATFGWASFARRSALLSLRLLVIYYKTRGAAAQAVSRLLKQLSSAAASMRARAAVCVAAMRALLEQTVQILRRARHASCKLARWQYTRVAAAISAWRFPLPPPQSSRVRAHNSESSAALYVLAATSRGCMQAARQRPAAQQRSASCGALSAGALISMAAAVKLDRNETKVAWQSYVVVLTTIGLLMLSMGMLFARRPNVNCVSIAAVTLAAELDNQPLSSAEYHDVAPRRPGSSRHQAQEHVLAAPQLSVRVRKAATWKDAVVDLFNGRTERIQALSPRIEAWASSAA